MIVFGCLIADCHSAVEDWRHRVRSQEEERWCGWCCVCIETWGGSGPIRSQWLVVALILTIVTMYLTATVYVCVSHVLCSLFVRRPSQTCRSQKCLSQQYNYDEFFVVTCATSMKLSVRLLCKVCFIPIQYLVLDCCDGFWLVLVSLSQCNWLDVPSVKNSKL